MNDRKLIKKTKKLLTEYDSLSNLLSCEKTITTNKKTLNQVILYLSN